MLSGADLIKTSGQIQDRAQRLKAVPSDVKAVESPAQTNTGLDQDTKSALARFARFINKEGDKGKKRPPKKETPKGVPQAYLNQIQSVQAEERSGGMLNIFA